MKSINYLANQKTLTFTSKKAYSALELWRKKNKNRMKIKLPFSGNFRISQLFGNVASMYTNLGLKGHNGIDFVCPTGTLIQASIKGVVEFVGQDSMAGKGVYIVSDLGQNEGYRTIYWHLQSFNVKFGDIVEE